MTPTNQPGEIVQADFVLPLGMSVANAIKVPRSRANHIACDSHSVTMESALRLARYFGTTPEFWLNLQARYDLDVAGRGLRRRIEREVDPRAT